MFSFCLSSLFEPLEQTFPNLSHLPVTFTILPYPRATCVNVFNNFLKILSKFILKRNFITNEKWKLFTSNLHVSKCICSNAYHLKWSCIPLVACWLWYAGKLVLRKKEPWLVAFVDFCGLCTFTLTNFSCQWIDNHACKIPEYLTTDTLASQDKLGPAYHCVYTTFWKALY